MKTEKGTHGGKRREGRNQSMKSYRIDTDLIERMKAHGNTNRFVNIAIREKLDRIGAIDKTAQDFSDIVTG